MRSLDRAFATNPQGSNFFKTHGRGVWAQMLYNNEYTVMVGSAGPATRSQLRSEVDRICQIFQIFLMFLVTWIILV